MIRFENVTKTYKGSTVALRDITVEIEKGEFVFLVGASGSGKTTFIRLLLREELPDMGQILEAGRNIVELPKWRVPYLRRNIGCVFQDFRLLPNKTVFENVAFALEVIGRPRHVVANQVPQVLDLVGLANKRDNLPNELSGGEQQRVAVARAFVNRPLILLADEPTGNLDPQTSQGIMQLLDRINRTGTTVVVATHDEVLVDKMRRRVIELSNGRMVRDQARRRVRLRRLRARGGLNVAVSVDYVVRETASNLWRNRLMTIAAVLTVAVSLSLVGAALLLRQGSANATGTLERGTQVTVWMEPNANAQEIAAVETELSQLNYVVQPCAYWNKARNFSEARRLLPSDVFQATTQSEMPTSYWCTPIALTDAAQVVHTFTGTAGVLSVTEPQQTIHNEETVINVSKWVFLAIAIVLIVSAGVLILNTIRMAIFARRREVSVMKLVGATNWFIRVPFMSEGLLQGLIGSLLAAVVVYFVYLFINHEGSGRTTSNIFTAMHMSGSEVLLTNAVVVIVGWRSAPSAPPSRSGASSTSDRAPVTGRPNPPDRSCMLVPCPV